MYPLSRFPGASFRTVLWISSFGGQQGAIGHHRPGGAGGGGALWWPGIDPGADWDEEGGAGALVVAVTTVLFAVGVGAYASGLARWGSAHRWDDPRWDQARRGVVGTTAGLLAYVALGPLSGPASIVAFVVGASCWIWAMVRLSQAHRELRERPRAAEAVRAS